MLSGLFSSWFSEKGVRLDYMVSNASVQHSKGMFAACTRQRKVDIVSGLTLEYCCHVLFVVHWFLQGTVLCSQSNTAVKKHVDCKLTMNNLMIRLFMTHKDSSWKKILVSDLELLVFCPLEVRFSHFTCFKGGLTEKHKRIWWGQCSGCSEQLVWWIPFTKS